MDYVRVTSEAEVASALRHEGAAILMGGTDLVVKMRGGSARPRLLVDASRVESLQAIAAVGAGVSIGAGARLEDILASPLVQERYPLLAIALQSLGSPQIRSRATLGGNLANASPAADAALPLLAYDARLALASAERERTLDLESFFRGPGRTALGPGEYVRSVVLPPSRPDWLPFFHKVGRRRALTIAVASVAGLLSVVDGRVFDLRIAAGSVGPTPLRLRAVEADLRGRSLGAATAREAGARARGEVSPIDDVRATAAYRRDVTGELVERFVCGIKARDASRAPAS